RRAIVRNRPQSARSLRYRPAPRPPLPAARVSGAEYRRHSGLGVKTMTISVQRLVVTAALLLVGVATSARAQGIETVTNVPFAFTAGDTNLPQDRYRISPMPGQTGVFMIHGGRNGVILMSLTDR